MQYLNNLSNIWTVLQTIQVWFRMYLVKHYKDRSLNYTSNKQLQFRFVIFTIWDFVEERECTNLLVARAYKVHNKKVEPKNAPQEDHSS